MLHESGAPGGTRTHDLRLRRAALYPLSYERTFLRFLVPKVGFEPTRPFGHYALNVARLPFRHFGTRNATVVGDAGLEPATSSV